MSQKSKGLNAERELIHKFWNNDWAAIRCAGSGSIKYPVPDILAGNNLRKIAIECKATISNNQYLTKKEIEELISFSRLFGAEPWIAIRFSRRGWFFFSPDNLNETENSFGISYEKSKLLGLTFEELIKQD